jgi:DNA-binding HxlR family transcriptional regulator
VKKPDPALTHSFSITNDENSPQKLLFERLANKWFLMILADLFHEDFRFNSLLKAHHGLSQKMLSQTLKNLEEDGLIDRKVNSNKIPVEVLYSITTFGRSLIEITIPLFEWSNQNVIKLHSARKKYAKKYQE